MPRGLPGGRAQIAVWASERGWTIHLKRAWVATLSGCHYDYIDFSIVAGQEAGTEESRRSIHTWVQHLTTLLHARDLVRGRPGIDWILDVPSNMVVATFGRGIGRAIALALAEDGVHVHVVARTAEQLHLHHQQGGRELVYALPGIGVSRHSGNGEHAAPGRTAERDVAANWR